MLVIVAIVASAIVVVAVADVVTGEKKKFG